MYTTGFIYDPDIIAEVTESLGKNGIFGNAAPHLKGIGKGKTVLLHKAYEKIKMKFPVLNQGSHGSCFVANQMVLMADGTEKPIQDVEIGDFVISHKNKIRRVTNTFKRSFTGNLVNTVVKGAKLSIISTDDHRFYTDDGLIKAENLKNRKVLIPFPTVTATEAVYYECKTESFYTQNTDVYCIEVEEDHSFICNGFAVSNCTSFGVAGAVDCLKAFEIASGERSEFRNITATEPIYRGGRLNNGKIIVRGEGAIVSLAVKYVGEKGTIARGKYGNIDLSEYSIERSKRWGQNSGFPKTVEDISKDYTIEVYTRIRSYEEWIDSIASGHPVVHGSSYGFSNKCNNDGFAAQNTSWSHCMWSCAIRHDKPGVLIVNSWGPNWNSMSVRRYGEPLGSFWITPEDCDKIARNGDCWSLAGHNGYNKEINTEIAW